jgi:hypothetical protein
VQIREDSWTTLFKRSFSDKQSSRKDTDKHDKQKARCTRIFGATGFFVENFCEYSTKASIHASLTA